MSMAVRRSHRRAAQKRAEARYRYRVDLPVPRYGLGRKIDDMDDWCHQYVGDFEHHGWQKRVAGHIPIDYIRYYFDLAEIARQFHKLFGGDISKRQQ